MFYAELVVLYDLPPRMRGDGISLCAQPAADVVELARVGHRNLSGVVLALPPVAEGADDVAGAAGVHQAQRTLGGHLFHDRRSRKASPNLAGVWAIAAGVKRLRGLAAPHGQRVGGKLPVPKSLITTLTETQSLPQPSFHRQSVPPAAAFRIFPATPPACKSREGRYES